MKTTSSSTLLGIVLAVSMFGAGVVTDRLTNVYITNLHLDDQGNLRVAAIQKSKEMLVFNQTLTVPSSNDYVYLTSVNTEGFKYFVMTAKASQGSVQIGAYLQICYFENNFGIRTFPVGTGGYTSLDTGANTQNPSWGCGAPNGRIIEVYASSIDLYLYVSNSNIGFNGLLTIAIYLTN